MLPRAETPRTSVFATNSAVAYHDSRCGLHHGKNLKQICGTALQTYSARLNTAGDSYSFSSLVGTPTVYRSSSGITATPLTCTPAGELRIGIVSNVPNKQQTSHCSFAFPASCRPGRQENSDLLKNTVHAPSPEPRPNSEAHFALRRQRSTFTVSFQPKFRPPPIPPPPPPGVYCIALFCVAESCNSPPKRCEDFRLRGLGRW